MVDFAISVNLVFYILKHYLLLDLSPTTVLIEELSNFNQSSFHDVPNMDCALHDDLTIVVAMVDFSLRHAFKLLIFMYV